MPEVNLETLKTDLESDRRYRERRHPQWTENYQLYRDTVITNRLTQRQSVNVPLMKETIRTQLSRAGEPAQLAFEDYGNDSQRELLPSDLLLLFPHRPAYEPLCVRSPAAPHPAP